MTAWQARDIQIGGAVITWLEAGQGEPLLILHDELGHVQWSGWHEDVAASRRLILPIAPGFRGPRLKWMRNVTDLARLYGRMLREQKLGPVDVIGFSFGGWVAAEMAVDDPAQFKRMALVAPFGIKPPAGFIMDMYIGTTAEYLRASLANPEATPEFATLFTAATPEIIESWEDARIETAQLAWEPYMHNPALDHHVQGLGSLPALIVWGDKDKVLPRSGAEAYAQAIPEARLEVLAGCGHRPEIEQRETFVKTLSRFFG